MDLYNSQEIKIKLKMVNLDENQIKSRHVDELYSMKNSFTLYAPGIMPTHGQML